MDNMIMKFLLSSVCLVWLKSGLVFSSCPDKDEFDYIVVGAGATGSVIAARLSENDALTVLLLEAGGEPSEKSNIPFFASDAIHTEMDWNYTSASQKHCCGVYKNNVMPLIRGRTLGGSASLNAMTYTRCNRKDYDLWEKQGNSRWGYKDVLKYFLKLEDYQIPHSSKDDQYHSTGGPITVSLPRFKTPLADAFIDAAKELAQPIVDFNAATQTGFMYPPTNSKNGARCSSYNCYVKPYRNRPNLIIRTDSLATKIIVNKNKQATGVDYLRKSEHCSAKARKEVIISGGTFNSPQLLMLSGIGPQHALKKLKIPIVMNLPGVGQNLQDHVVYLAQVYTLEEKVSLNREKYNIQKYLDEWYVNRTGPLTVPAAVEGAAFYQTKLVKNETDFPDVEIYFISDRLTNILNKFQTLPPTSFDKDVFTILPFILRPKSRGSVTLRSKNPEDYPIINPNFMSHPADVNTMIEAIKISNQLGTTNAFRKYGAKLQFPDFVPQCAKHALLTKYNKCVAKFFSSSGMHPTSTCKMGPKTDPMAVVDERLRVRGIKRLRVADASIMPNIVSGHPNVPCMMIGEKVSDMIKEDNK